MWQRIQTVFLIIAIISLIAAILMPIWVHEAIGQNHKLYALHYSITAQSGVMISTDYLPYCLTAILAIASITISVIEIGQYRNRILQMKLGHVNLDYFQEKFGVDIGKRFAGQLGHLQEEGLLNVNDREVKLSRDGLLCVDTLLHEFFLQQHRTSQIV